MDPYLLRGLKGCGLLLAADATTKQDLALIPGPRDPARFHPRYPRRRQARLTNLEKMVHLVHLARFGASGAFAVGEGRGNLAHLENLVRKMPL